MAWEFVGSVDTSRYVLSAASQSMAAILGIALSALLVAAQLSRYRLPARRIMRFSWSQRASFVLILAGVVLPLVVLLVEAWNMTNIVMFIWLAGVVWVTPTIRGALRAASPGAYIGYLRGRVLTQADYCDLVEVAVQAAQLGDEEMLSTLLTLGFSGQKEGDPPMMVSLVIPKVLMQTAQMSAPTQRAICDALAVSCCAQLSFWGFGTESELSDAFARVALQDEGGYGHATPLRSNRWYRFANLDALSNLAIGFGSMRSGWVGHLLGDDYVVLLVRVVHSLLYVEASYEKLGWGDGMTEEEYNALWGLRDGLLMLEPRAIADALKGCSVVAGYGEDALGPVDIEMESYNDVVRMLLDEGLESQFQGFQYLYKDAENNFFRRSYLSAKDYPVQGATRIWRSREHRDVD